MGTEGPTDDPQINNLRERQIRNFLATLMLSQGVPMLTGGDEVARSQRGNNNCYCQNNELTWFDWDLDASRKRLRDFASQLIQFRLSHPNLHRRKFFQDREIRTKDGNTVIQDIAWYNPDGNQVEDEVWSAVWNRSIGLLLNGQTLQVTNDEGKPVIDDSFLVLVNASHEGVEFTLPPLAGSNWNQVIDTENIDGPFAKVVVDDKVIVGGRSLKLLSDETPKS
jgi:isoamylase